MNRIIDIPKIQDHIKSMKKINNKKLSYDQLKIKKDFEKILMLPDKFNTCFSKECWIAFDFFDDKIMKNAINIYEAKKNIEEVDNFLAEQYNENTINQFIAQIECFKNCNLINLPNMGTLFIKYFLDRIEIIQTAQEDYLNGRYYSCIPLLLSVIDGITNDIDHSFGFFNDNIDLILENSIVGHETGLNAIQKIVTQSRKKTNFEQITIPYRNGILHGRDLSYGNKIVAAKCWNLLFVLKDWAKDNNVKNFIVENSKPIIKEDIDKYVNKDLNITINTIFEKLKDGNKNYELIYFNKYPTNIYSKNYRMSEFGRLFKNIKFLNLKKNEQKILNETSNIVLCNVDIEYLFEQKESKMNQNILFEYSDIENNLVDLTNQNGHWKMDFLSLLGWRGLIS